MGAEGGEIFTLRLDYDVDVFFFHIWRRGFENSTGRRVCGGYLKFYALRFAIEYCIQTLLNRGAHCVNPRPRPVDRDVT